MRKYESIIVFHPESTEDARREVQDKLRGVVERHGGEVEIVDDWGKRKLAYAVKKQRYGQMARVQLHADPKVVTEIEQVFHHAEAVIKAMTCVVDERIQQQKAAVDATGVPVALDSPDNGRRRR